ncbi:hypothetical protein [Taibaiella helva]|uniref:hypothetical protein n=1 Tax=Taibaiella helva TaxID=2301235 RepID=UPI000E56FAFA|nr:hypothetical protein [Taibaiella helva]
MKTLKLLIALLCGAVIASAQDNEYNYPVDKETGKITYEKTKTVAGTQHNLFKYGLQFVASQNFNREVATKTKMRKVFYTTIVITTPITYQDEEQGKIFGNGFFDFEYRGKQRFVVTFSYKIYVKDQEYRYVFTDFVVKEFVGAGEPIAKRHINSATAPNSSARILSFPLEEFIERSKYADSDQIFKDNIKQLKTQLAKAMAGDL